MPSITRIQSRAAQPLVERLVLLPEDVACRLTDYAAAHGDKPTDTAVDIIAEFFDCLTEPFDGEVLP